jgi:thiol-disulfide isomerase/thioredoxin
MKYVFISVILCLLLGRANSQSIRLDGKFTLSATIIGKDTGLIMFWYINAANKVVEDTLELRNGKFEIAGTINRACEAILWTDIKVKIYDDPSSVRFLLEPGKITVVYYIDHPLKPLIRGSESQSEKERWDEKKSALLLAKSNIRDSIQNLEKKRGNGPAIKDPMNRLAMEYDSINANIRRLDVRYIKSHPGSYLSAYLLSRQERRLQIDSIEIYYQGLSAEVKLSSLGRIVLSYVYPLTEDNEFRKANPFIDKEFEQRLEKLESVYELALSDTAGKVVKFDSFRNKYLVIDFWASWCKPCLENIPYLNELAGRYEHDSVEFISISLDKDVSQWKKSVFNSKIQGVQLSDSSGFNGLAAIYCKTLWVPHYVIADKSGRIINYDAPQANEPALRNLLDGILFHQY